MGVAENIKRLRELHGMTQEEFGKLAGVSAMAVSQWENGRAVPRMGAVERMATFLNVPKGEIIDGESRKTPKAITPTEPRQAYLPLLGRVHAGDAQEPQVLDERISLPYEIWEHHPDSYFLEVEGQCMSKVYPESSYILIDPKKQPSNGSIAVVSIDGADYVMRRLYRGASVLVLSPDSWEDDYEDIVISDQEDHTVEYVGVVVWYQAAHEME